MTSIKLYEVGYGEAGHGSVTIMLNNGGFFLIRDGIPHEDGEDEIDDPGIEISMADMEAFCRAALTHIEHGKPRPGPQPKPEPGVEDIKIYDLGISVRLCNILQSAFGGGWDGWPEIPVRELTLGDICKHSQREYMKFRNFGRRSLFELESLLEKFNLELKKR